MRIYNERPISKINKGLAADSVFVFASLVPWASLLIGFNFILFWLAI